MTLLNYPPTRIGHPIESAPGEWFLPVKQGVDGLFGFRRITEREAAHWERIQHNMAMAAAPFMKPMRAIPLMLGTERVGWIMPNGRIVRDETNDTRIIS